MSGVSHAGSTASVDVVGQGSPSAWELVTLGSTMLGCIVGGLLIGLLIDHYAHTSPACTLSGIGVGLAGAGMAMYGQVRKFLK